MPITSYVSVITIVEKIWLRSVTVNSTRPQTFETWIFKMGFPKCVCTQDCNRILLWRSNPNLRLKNFSMSLFPWKRPIWGDKKCLATSFSASDSQPFVGSFLPNFKSFKPLKCSDWLDSGSAASSRATTPMWLKTKKIFLNKKVLEIFWFRTLFRIMIYLKGTDFRGN